MSNNDLIKKFAIKETAVPATQSDSGTVTRNVNYENAAPGLWNDEKLEKFCNEHNVKILSRKNEKDRIYLNIICPWESDHSVKSSPSECSVFVRNGHVCFKCMHQSHESKTGSDFLKFYDPSARQTDKRKKHKRKIKIVCFEDIEERKPEWLIPHYIRANQLNAMTADGGSGKGFIISKLIACLTTGQPFWVEGKNAPMREPKTVLYMSGEDDPADTIKRRCRLAGADMKRLFTFELPEIHDPDDPEENKYPTYDSSELEEIISELRPDLVIFDPWQSFLDEGVRIAERNAVRRNLQPLIVFGQKYRTTSLIIVHTNKQSGVWARKRMADSADLWDAARSVFAVGSTKDPKIRYLSHEKSNGSKLQQTVLFSIQDDGTEDNACAFFEGLSTLKDKDFVLENDKKNGRPDVQKKEAREYILYSVAENRVQVGKLKDNAKSNGIKPETFDNAVTELINEGVIKRTHESQGYKRGVTVFLEMALAPTNPSDE